MRLYGTLSLSLAAMACSQPTQGQCVQSVASTNPSAYGSDLVGGFVTTDNKVRCAMNLRIIEATPQSFRARIETATHCSEQLGSLTSRATLSLFAGSAYHSEIPFVGQFDASLMQLADVLAAQNPSGRTFANWATLRLDSPGRGARQLQATSTKGTLEQDLLTFRSGCPADLGPGRVFCASAGDLFLDHVVIQRQDVAHRHINQNMTLAAYLDERATQHQPHLERESSASLQGTVAAQAQRLFELNKRRAAAERLQQILPLTDLAGTCSSVDQDGSDLEGFLADVKETNLGESNSLVLAFGLRLAGSPELASSVWHFCKSTTSQDLQDLQARLDRIPVSLDQTLGDARRALGNPGWSEDAWQTLASDIVEQTRSAWQVIETHLEEHLEEFSFATNALEQNRMTFRSAPLSQLLKQGLSAGALVHDSRNFGPVFVAGAMTDFALDWQKGSSGSIISFTGSGLYLPLAALTSLDSGYSSGGIAVLPLPQSQSIPMAQDRPEGSSNHQDAGDHTSPRAGDNQVQSAEAERAPSAASHNSKGSGKACL